MESALPVIELNPERAGPARSLRTHGERERVPMARLGQDVELRAVDRHHGTARRTRVRDDAHIPDEPDAPNAMLQPPAADQLRVEPTTAGLRSMFVTSKYGVTSASWVPGSRSAPMPLLNTVCNELSEPHRHPGRRRLNRQVIEGRVIGEQRLVGCEVERHRPGGAIRASGTDAEIEHPEVLWHPLLPRHAPRLQNRRRLVRRAEPTSAL